MMSRPSPEMREASITELDEAWGTAALSLRERRRANVARDLVAGLSVALVLISQALAYALRRRCRNAANLGALLGGAATPRGGSARLVAVPADGAGGGHEPAHVRALAGRAPVGSPEYVQRPSTGPTLRR